MGHWSSFAYQYIVGGIIFAIPIYLGFKKGVLNMKNRLDRRIIASLIAAYLIYFVAHGVWNIIAINSGGT